MVDVTFFLILLHLLSAQAEIKFNNDRNLTYSCSYTPKMEGAHSVGVRSSLCFFC